MGRTRHAAALLLQRLLARTPYALVESAHLLRTERLLHWNQALLGHQLTADALPHAQIGQDLFVLIATSFKRDGFFVEFGATDGVNLSNTYLLERSFGWKGILAEPATDWHAALRQNRECAVDTRCVWATSGERLEFAQTAEPEYSTVRNMAGLEDGHEALRAARTTYKVASVSLNDLLDEHSAPSRIDYLSIDTEGSEYEILQAFDFTSREICLITVEHNFDRVRRSRIYDLLIGHGFSRVLEDMSLWDDWYVLGSAFLGERALDRFEVPSNRE
jgi:FkbM family methyltransferase